MRLRLRGIAPLLASRLRAAARMLERRHGRPEFDPDRPRTGRHAGIVRRLRICMSPFLPSGRVVVEGVAVAMPGRPDSDGPAYRTPDLAVCPSAFLSSDDRFLHPQDVSAAVVVLGGAEAEQEPAATVAWYGRAGVPSLLVIDPASRRWTLHSEPVIGSYWLTEHGALGDEVPLPTLQLRLLTDQLLPSRV